MKIIEREQIKLNIKKINTKKWIMINNNYFTFNKKYMHVFKEQKVNILKTV